MIKSCIIFFFFLNNYRHLNLYRTLIINDHQEMHAYFDNGTPLTINIPFQSSLYEYIHFFTFYFRSTCQKTRTLIVNYINHPIALQLKDIARRLEKLEIAP